jgi:hypothetical protein
MTYIPDFDVDDIAAVLESVSQRLAENSKERDAIELAQIALLYPRHIRNEDGFRRYYKEFFDPAFKVKISQEFPTREEADKWLASGKAQEAELVKIADKGFQVARLPGRLTLIDRPLPEELEAEEAKTDSE